MFAERFKKVRNKMVEKNVDVLLLSVGPDLPWLTGYKAMPLERLTMLVLPQDGPATLVLPQFEIARVVQRPELFSVLGWTEAQDPIKKVADLVGGAKTLAVGDHTWSRFLVDLFAQLPGVSWRRSASITGRLRAVKDQAEIDRLQFAADGVDRIGASLQAGEIPIIGRSEADIAADIGERILAEGHAKVNFTIVASGPNGASPHHESGSRIIQPNEPFYIDFGGTTAEPEGQPGYCSDMTRCFYTGEVAAEFQEAYDALFEAQERGFQAATVGTAAQDVDRAARNYLAEAGLGEYFTHRLGHGIGVEAHEDPYLVEGNSELLESGNAFSVEPGFYVPNKWGARIEDIVIATDDGPRRLNTTSRHLAIIDE